MAAVLNTNMASLYAQKNLSTAQASLAASVQRLSSGTRINSAKDDAAGYGISESVKGTKNIVDQNIRNAQDGISFAQTAEGALDVVGKILQRSLTLITQKTDGTLNSDQQASIDNELAALKTEVNNITLRTKFQGGGNEVSVFGSNSMYGGYPVLAADASGNLSATGEYGLVNVNGFQGGANGVTNVALSFTDESGNMHNANGDLLTDNQHGYAVATSALYTVSGDYLYLSSVNYEVTGMTNMGAPTDWTVSGLNTTSVGNNVYALSPYLGSGQIYSSSISVETGSNSATQVTATMIDSSLIDGSSTVSEIQGLIQENATNRGNLGAAINSLGYAVDNMQTLSNNLADGISRIVDTDYAAETANLTKSQILQQAATSMLAQANQMPNVVLTLLK